MYYREPTERANKLITVSAGLVIVIFLTQLVMFSSTDIVLIRQGVAYLHDDWRPALDILCAVMLSTEYVFILLCVSFVRVRGMAAKLLCAFLTWIIVTRVLCGDPTLVESVEYVRVAVLCVALLCFSMTLEKRERRRMLGALAAIICVHYLVIAVLTLAVAVTRENIQLPLGIGITIKEEAGFSFVTVVGRHRNTVSMWSVIGLCLAAYLFSLTKNKLPRAICVIASLVFYAAVSISRSRLSMLALSVAVSMYVMLPVLKKLSGKKTAVRIAAALLTALIIIPLSYKSYDAVAAVISGANGLVQAQDQSQYEASTGAEVNEIDTETKPQTEKNAQLAENGDAQNDMFKETRDADNAKNLGGRVRLWKSVYGTLYFERDRLLRGSLTNDYMYTVNMLSGFPDPADGELNTHNYLVEALMLTGILGFLLLLAFTLILVIRMVRVFFCDGADMPGKLMVVLLTTTLVKNMGEAMLMRSDDVTNYVFFLAAGAFLAFSYELIPEKSRKK